MNETREQWLDKAVETFRPSILHATGRAVPTTIKVACGFPSKGGLATKKRRVGECWGSEAVTQDDTAYIFISPLQDEPVDVLATLLHELVHSALPAKTKHNKTFAQAVAKLGLEGKPTSTVAGEVLAKTLREQVLSCLGEYPHKAWTPTGNYKKQSARLRLYECDCPVKVRVASDTFNATCNECEGVFKRQASEESGC